MYTKNIYIIASIIFLFVSGCGSKISTEDTTTIDTLIDTTNEVISQPESPIPGWTILLGDTDTATVTQTLATLEKIAIQDNSRGFLQNESIYTTATNTNTSVKINQDTNQNTNTGTQTASEYLDIAHKGVASTRGRDTSNGANQINTILGLQEKIINVYGPFINLYAQDQTYIIYTTTNFDNQGQIKQHTVNLDTNTRSTEQMYYLYRSIDSDLLIGTKVQNNGNLYGGVFISQGGNPFEQISDVAFDAFAYDANYLYVYAIDRTTELSTIYIIDIAEGKILTTIDRQNIGGGGATFYLENDILYMSYGLNESFETITTYLTAYDIYNDLIVRKVKSGEGQ